MSQKSPGREASTTGEKRVVHTCHWPSCSAPVPPARWGCSRHWFTLPKPLRDRVWAAYRPGQEITKTPSREYLEVVHEVHAWAQAYEATRSEAPTGAGRQLGLDL